MYQSNRNLTELYYERHELLIQEARNARLARKLKAARRKQAPGRGSGRIAELLLRVIAPWGRTGIPFFKA